MENINIKERYSLLAKSVNATFFEKKMVSCISLTHACKKGNNSIVSLNPSISAVLCVNAAGRTDNRLTCYSAKK